MQAIDDQVRLQYERFQMELPSMIETQLGKWVVFLDGIQTIEESEEAALGWAGRHMKPSVGFVIARIEPPTEALLTAAVAYRFGV